MCLPQQTRELSINPITNIAIFSLRRSLKVIETQCGVNLGGGGADAWRCAGIVEVGLEARISVAEMQAERFMILGRPTEFFPILSSNIDGVIDVVACTRRMVKVWAKGCGFCPEAECQDHATCWWAWPDAGLPERCTTATCADCRRRIKHAPKTCSRPTLHQPNSHGCWHDEASIAVHRTSDCTHRLPVPPALLFHC